MNDNANTNTSTSPPATRFTVVGLGEALFDRFPSGDVLGGAPLNGAVHVHQLGQRVGGRGVVVTRIGQDTFGQRLIDELHQRDMDTTYVQTDPDHATGMVYVSVDDAGQPDYEIVRDSAWDKLAYDPDTEQLAARCDAVCFGTLAQRDAQARSSIKHFLHDARRAIRLFDVNLRQNYYDQRLLVSSCENATVIKLNIDELPIVARLLGVGSDNDATEARVQSLRKRYGLKYVALTRGSQGTQLFTENNIHTGAVPTYPAVADADSVGAGDACTAGLIIGMLLRKTPDKIVELANHAGAFVASQRGATPTFPDNLLTLVAPPPHSSA